MRLLNNDDFTASLAWSTCNSAGVSPENKEQKFINLNGFEYCQALAQNP